MKSSTKILASLLCLLGILGTVETSTGQEIYQIDTSESKIWVEGSSTLKDWTAVVNDWEGTITTTAEGTIESVDISLIVKSMEGGRGPDMNAKIFKALKDESHPKITFKGAGASATDGADLAVKGTFAMAGKSKDITVGATGSLDQGLKGSYALKLSDFDIDPPTALFGAIVTYDDVKIVYELTLIKI